MELEFQVRGAKYKEKRKSQIGIHIVLTNYEQDKYIKLLFLNTLKCNHLPKKKTTK